MDMSLQSPVQVSSGAKWEVKRKLPIKASVAAVRVDAGCSRAGALTVDPFKGLEAFQSGGRY
jgi:hypothetical protein